MTWLMLGIAAIALIVEVIVIVQIAREIKELWK